MILITGARGVVGKPLCERLTRENKEYMAVSRQAESSNNELQWDLSNPPSNAVKAKLAKITALIHCAPIWLLPAHLETLTDLKIQQLVVFSSTSVSSKQNSKNQQEQELVTQLFDAEQSLLEQCKLNNTQLTILRPSLIYGYGRDQNISHIAQFIKRFRFMVLMGKASGLRQPVHADDLVDVVLASLLNRPHKQQVYIVAGKEVLSYRDMVKRIFVALDQRPLIISIPLWLFRPALVIAAKISGFSYTTEMAERMNQDLNYDYTDAANDLNFSPQKFLKNPDRDLTV